MGKVDEVRYIRAIRLRMYKEVVGDGLAAVADNIGNAYVSLLLFVGAGVCYGYWGAGVLGDIIGCAQLLSLHGCGGTIVCLWFLVGQDRLDVRIRIIGRPLRSYGFYGLYGAFEKEFLVFGSEFRVPSFEFRVSSFEFRVPS